MIPGAVCMSESHEEGHLKRVCFTNQICPYPRSPALSSRKSRFFSKFGKSYILCPYAYCCSIRLHEVLPCPVFGRFTVERYNYYLHLVQTLRQTHVHICVKVGLRSEDTHPVQRHDNTFNLSIISFLLGSVEKGEKIPIRNHHKNRNQTRSLAQRNLLAMTAIMRRTKTVIMAMVITRFVAILLGSTKVSSVHLYSITTQ